MFRSISSLESTLCLNGLPLNAGDVSWPASSMAATVHAPVRPLLWEDDDEDEDEEFLDDDEDLDLGDEDDEDFFDDDEELDEDEEEADDDE